MKNNDKLKEDFTELIQQKVLSDKNLSEIKNSLNDIRKSLNAKSKSINILMIVSIITMMFSILCALLH